MQVQKERGMKTCTKYGGRNNHLTRNLGMDIKQRLIIIPLSLGWEDKAEFILNKPLLQKERPFTRRTRNGFQ